ncbi:hypothetical protein AURDEDRAFT_164139 [Auricularia subglabra TFB-10046 SS5]|nr:hypothetical protein AURDEDRAFT_164139 [Auricularia subglabra TFB-10046 SS5]
MVPIAEVEFVNNCLRFVPITLLIYDWALMLEEEVDLIWRRPLRPNQFAFLAVRSLRSLLSAPTARIQLRYGPIVPMSLAVFGFVPVSDRVSTARLAVSSVQSSYTIQVYRIQSDVGIGAMIIIISIVQILLQVRVYAMYNRNRTILWTNAALFAVEYAVTIYLFLHFSSQITNVNNTPTHRCRACSIYPRSFGFSYITPFCYELYLVFLAARKSWINRESSRQLGGNSTVSVLVRGNVHYFILVASGMAISVILFFAAPVRPLASALSATYELQRFVLWVDLLTDATGVIGGTRLILSVRKALLAPAPLSDANTIQLVHVNSSSARNPWAGSDEQTLA